MRPHVRHCHQLGRQTPCVQLAACTTESSAARCSRGEHDPRQTQPHCAGTALPAQRATTGLRNEAQRRHAGGTRTAAAVWLRPRHPGLLRSSPPANNHPIPLLLTARRMALASVSVAIINMANAATHSTRPLRICIPETSSAGRKAGPQARRTSS